MPMSRRKESLVRLLGALCLGTVLVFAGFVGNVLAAGLTIDDYNDPAQSVTAATNGTFTNTDPAASCLGSVRVLTATRTAGTAGRIIVGISSSSFYSFSIDSTCSGGGTIEYPGSGVNGLNDGKVGYGDQSSRPVSFGGNSAR